MFRDGQSLTFKYNHNGMRIQKVLEHSWYPETKNYTYRGNLLTHMEVVYTYLHEDEHTDSINLFYDAQSGTAKAISSGETCTYPHNPPSDIVGIVDSIGMLMVEYKYDTWGKPLATTGSLANMPGIRNPFHYRGYIFDDETNPDAVFAYPEEEGDYDLPDTYPVGFQTSLGVSWGVDFAHIIKSYTIVTTLDSRNYSLLGRSKNRYTVRSSASKFRVEMDR